MERSGKINRKLGKLNTALNVYSIEIVLKYKMVEHETCNVHKTCTVHELCIVNELCTVH